MNIIKFDVEYQGNQEVTINGRNVLDQGCNGYVDEKIFTSRLDGAQQHAVMCMLRQLAEKVWWDVQQARLRRGEITLQEFERLRF